MEQASFGLDIGIFCDFLHSVLLLNATSGLNFLGLALSWPRHQVLDMGPKCFAQRGVAPQRGDKLHLHPGESRWARQSGGACDTASGASKGCQGSERSICGWKIRRSAATDKPNLLVCGLASLGLEVVILGLDFLGLALSWLQPISQPAKHAAPLQCSSLEAECEVVDSAVFRSTRKQT
jgi:hypothetical protein